ncbi:MAG: ATP-binding protein [Gaiellaceae bacterium]
MSRRLLASYLSLALFILLVLEIPLGVFYQRNALTALEDKVERDAVNIASIADGVLPAGSPGARRVLENYALTYRKTGGRVIVVDVHGRLLIDSATPHPRPRSFASRPEVAAALSGAIATGTRYSNTLHTKLLYVAVPVAAAGDVNGAVRITYPTSAVDHRVYHYWLILAAIGAVILGVVALVGVLLARWTTQPLLQLGEAVAATGAGDLASRAPTETGPPEVRELARAFNEMAAQLERLVESQQAFVADASHQLRTPLTALRLRLENLERDVDPAGRAELEGALAEVERLGRLVEGLLALARADAGALPEETVDLERAVGARRGAGQALADEREVELVGDLDGARTARASPERLGQVLDNLLANAIEVSPRGGSIRLTGRPSEEWVELHVVDQGPGMAPEERAHAFDRFWRAGGEGSGFGLGLAIVRRLVAADGGEVELREAPGGGLDAVVRLRRG